MGSKSSPDLSDKKHYLPLLLLGDEQESMIDRYLERGEMFVMLNRETTPVAVAVVTDEGGGILELKNLAVHPLCQRKGYGQRMIAYVCEHYKDRFHTLLAGTGDSRQTLSFYKNCGFTYSHTVRFHVFAYRSRLFLKELRPPDCGRG